MLAFRLLLLLQAPAAAPVADLLPAGDPVGFTQAWLIDSTRRLPHGDRYDHRYRPVLLNLWYPAVPGTGRAMRYRDYFDGAAAAARPAGLARYAADLLAYQRGVVWQELVGSEPDSAPPPLRTAVEAMMTAPVRPRRDAARRTGPFRGVAIYVQGAGSSYDDNAALCEYLAGRGYLVLGSAFPEEGGEGFATNASDGSRPRDVRRLVLELTRLLGADPGRVAVIGHSAGAQAGFLMTADPGAPIDALLSLDTTEDYSALSDRSWAYYTDKVVAARGAIRLPILVAAGPDALFELADSLAGSPRTLLTVPGLDHNDFIAQGVLSRHLKAGARAAARDSAVAGYRALSRYLGDWLDAFFGERAPPPSTGAGVALVPLAPGVRFPDRIPEVPGTARELRHLFATGEPQDVADRLLRARAARPEIATDNVIMMLAVDWVRRGAGPRVRAILDEIRQRAPAVNVEEAIERRAALFDRIGAADLARQWRDVLKALAPTRGD